MAPGHDQQVVLTHWKAVNVTQEAKQIARTVDKDLSTHILPTSATMVGVCMTVLSLGHLARGGETRLVIDKLLAVDALMFLCSAVLSYMSMRSRRRRSRYESRAEMLFVAGLGLLAVGAVSLAFAIR